jgi:hypothetical protein
MTVARGVRTGTVWVNTFMDGYPELLFAAQTVRPWSRAGSALWRLHRRKTIQFHRGQRTGWWVG